MSSLKLAVTAASLADDIRTAAAAAQKIGFAGLVVPSRTPTVDLTELSDTGSREYRHILSSFGQNLVAIDSTLGKDGFSPRADIDRALARLQKVIAAAANLGRAMVCLDLGPLPPAPVTEQTKPTITPEQAGLIMIPQHKPGASDRLRSPQAAPDSSRAEKRDLAFESTLEGAIKELGQHADKLGTMVALRSGLSGFASLQNTINASRCPWFGIDLDTVHMLADEWSSDDIFSRLGAHIRHVRARDAAKGAGGRVSPCAVGAGNVDWKVIFNNLDATGYNGFVTIDTTDLPNRAAAAESGFYSLARYSGRGPG